MATRRKQPSEVRDQDINIESADSDYFVGTPTVMIEALPGTDGAIPATDDPTPQLVAGPGLHPPAALVGNPTETIKVWVGAGTDNVRYKVTVNADTFYGRHLEHDFFVKVADK